MILNIHIPHLSSKRNKQGQEDNKENYPTHKSEPQKQCAYKDGPVTI